MIRPGSSEGRLILTNRQGQQGIAFVQIKFIAPQFGPAMLWQQQNKRRLQRQLHLQETA